MIKSAYGDTHIEGTRLDIILDFDEIFRIIFMDNPEIVQATILAHEQELQNAKIDETVFVVVEKILNEKRNMMKKGEQEDDESTLF